MTHLAVDGHHGDNCLTSSPVVYRAPTACLELCQLPGVQGQMRHGPALHEIASRVGDQASTSVSAELQPRISGPEGLKPAPAQLVQPHLLRRSSLPGTAGGEGKAPQLFFHVCTKVP